jgi:hypothetical protein
MRVFSIDGRSWVVRPELLTESGRACGWETILFESSPAGAARLVYRPAGWLRNASDSELAAALAEAEPVRARWGSTDT